MVVSPRLPAPPAIPVRPFTNPLFCCANSASNGQRFNAAANCSVGKYRHNQYQAVKMPALTPNIILEDIAYRGIRQSIWFIVFICLIPMK